MYYIISFMLALRANLQFKKHRRVIFYTNLLFLKTKKRHISGGH